MKVKIWPVALSILFAFASRSPAQTDPLSQWSWRNPMPTANALTGVAYGTNTYVAAGYNGTILTSADASHWTEANSESFAPLYGISYVNNEFVAVGGEAIASGVSDAILTSPDGGFWTSYTSGAYDILQSVTFGNNQYVAVGYYPNTVDGAIVTSSDGVNWTNSSTITNTVLFGGTFGNNLFVIVGYDQTILAGRVFISSDGFNWTNCPSGVRTNGSGFRGVAYGNGQFVAAGGSAVVTSPDGMNWTTISDPNFAEIFAVTYGNGQFVAARSDGAMMTSPNGTNWTILSTGTTYESEAIGFGAGKFVAVGCPRDGLSGSILTSSDATNWSNPFADAGAGSGYFLGAATSGTNQSGANMFVAVGYWDNDDGLAGAILTSPDGATWTAQSSDAATFLHGIGCGNNTFVAVGSYGLIEISTDGVNWTNTGVTSTNGPTNGPPVLPGFISGPSLNSVAYGAGKFVVVGETILTSTTGTGWMSQTADITNALTSVVWSGSQFVAVGDYGTIITSTNGVDWTTQLSGTTSGLVGVAYGDNMFVATSGGTFLTSPDGVAWTSHTTSANLLSVAWGGNEFAAVGGTAGIATSSDGINWTNRLSPFTTALWGIAYDQSSFVAVGEAGEILQSGVLATPGIGVPNLVAGGGVRMMMTGKPGKPMSVQASTDLVKWVNVTNIVLRTTSGAFIDPSAGSYQQRFYRIAPQ